MSRIFEALQQSESERNGGLPEPVLAVTDLLRAAERNGVETVTRESRQNHVLRSATGLDESMVPIAERSRAETVSEDSGQNRVLRSAMSPDNRMVSISSRWGLAAEKFRLLGLRLRQLHQKRQIKTVLITSTLAEEGKSFVSANLAITMSRKKDQKVLLVDGDLRRPTLGNNFGLCGLSGLSECLKRGTPPDQSIYFIADLGFWFLPAGAQPDNALELMQSGGLTEIIKKLSSFFDWVIIDSPPLLPLADTTLWSRIVDGTLLVTRQGRTEKRQLKRAVECLDQASILGVVINSSSNADHKNYYQRYGYGSPAGEDSNAVVTPIA